jgi:hypothetical protein
MKNLFYFIPVFIWATACSQSAPNSNTGGQASGQHSILTDTAGNSLGNSPDGAFRLFKFAKQTDAGTTTDLMLLRLGDLKEIPVATLAPDTTAKDPGMQLKYYWSKDGRYLITNRSVQDSTHKNEVIMFDLQTLEVAQANKGYLMGIEAMHEVVFYYRPLPDRQEVCFYTLADPKYENTRGITAAPAGRLPNIIFDYKEKKARIKAYTTGGTPVNVAVVY